MSAPKARRVPVDVADQLDRIRVEIAAIRGLLICVSNGSDGLVHMSEEAQSGLISIMGNWCDALCLLSRESGPAETSEARE